MGPCAAPVCEYAYAHTKRRNWYCNLTKKECVVSREHAGYLSELDAKFCPGYNLPKHLAVAVMQFRKEVGIPLTFRENRERTDRIAQLEREVNQREAGK